MKKILSLLTLALLGAAVTAFADNFYYGYYQDPTLTYDAKGSKVSLDKWSWYESDSVSYSNTSSIVRATQLNSTLAGAKNNFFRLEFDKNNVEVYLTDFVSELYDDTMPFNSSTNALFNATYDEYGVLAKSAIVTYGYRKLTLEEDGTYTPDTITHKFEIFADEKHTVLNTDNVTPIDTVVGENENKTIRYQYSLGTTFGKEDVIELYMKDAEGNEVYSFSSYDAATGEFVPFNPNTGSDVSNELMPGGYNDGGYVISKIETDEMLNSYYFPDREAWQPFDKTGPTPAAEKAMPLAQLITHGGKAVSFGIYTSVVGSPLPGGLQIALIAGLFGLGFWYIRRRKAVAA